MFWNFTGRGRKALERIDKCPLLVQWDRLHEMGNLCTPSLGYCVHQLAPLFCQGEPNQTSIASFVSPRNQTLFDQAITHARGGRRRDVNGFSKFGEALWATGRKDDESSVLGEGDFFSDVTE